MPVCGMTHIICIIVSTGFCENNLQISSSYIGFVVVHVHHCRISPLAYHIFFLHIVLHRRGFEMGHFISAG